MPGTLQEGAAELDHEPLITVTGLQLIGSPGPPDRSPDDPSLGFDTIISNSVPNHNQLTSKCLNPNRPNPLYEISYLIQSQYEISYIHPYLWLISINTAAHEGSPFLIGSLLRFRQ